MERTLFSEEHHAFRKAFRQFARDVAARISVVQLQNSDVIPLTVIE